MKLSVRSTQTRKKHNEQQIHREIPTVTTRHPRTPKWLRYRKNIRRMATLWTTPDNYGGSVSSKRNLNHFVSLLPGDGSVRKQLGRHRLILDLRPKISVDFLVTVRELHIRCHRTAIGLLRTRQRELPGFGGRRDIPLRLCFSASLRLCVSSQSAHKPASIAHFFQSPPKKS